MAAALSSARRCSGRSISDRAVSNAVLSQIENGHVKDPGFFTVVKIAKALGLKLDRLAKCEPPDD
jgi:transcriptional regulator with XRE-family HTH domain